MGLELAHHDTRQVALAAAERNTAVNARVDSAEAVLQSFSMRLAGTPTHSDVQIRVADSVSTQRHFLEQGLAQALRSDALIRAELADIRRLGLQKNSEAAEHVEFPRKEQKREREAFYLAIEDHFRGSREILSERLSVYVPILRESGMVTVKTPLLDLGAGRGEFVKLLNAESLPARGIDGNAVAVAEGQALGIPVEFGDLFNALYNAPSNSRGAVSAIHVIEHLPFDRLVELCEQSLRALVPGGSLTARNAEPIQYYRRVEHISF